MSRLDPLQRRYPWAKIVLSPDTIVPHRVPFPLARRLHQICAAVLAETIAGEELPAPLRYAVLAVVDDFPGIDQRGLAMLAGVDRTNIGQIIDELEAKGLVERRISKTNRRAHALTATPRGKQVRAKMRPKVLAGQDRILAPLKPAERVTLIDLMVRVVEANEAYARPGAGRRPPKKTNQTDQGGRHDQQKASVLHGNSGSSSSRSRRTHTGRGLA
jgi:MarR family transcriptional regulator, temperature-dependent positive regulator of motility